MISSRVVSRSTSSVVEVAVVDPDHVAAELQRPLELGLVVDLDETIEIEQAGFLVEQPQIVVVERGDDQQDGVGSVDRRLVELVRRRR